MGKAGSGKTTVAEILEGFLEYQRMSLAGPLKDIAAELWGDEARTDRGKLQKLGVAVRDIEEDSWVNLLVRKATDPDRPFAHKPIVVDDVRFPNEYWGLKEAGFFIVEVRADTATRVDRLKANGKWQSEEQLEHISETALDDAIYKPDFIIGNYDNKNYLADSVTQMLNRIRRKMEVW